MRFTDGGEGTFGANAGLPTVALDLLKSITAKYVTSGTISNADLWTLAANVAIEVMGGQTMHTRFGRSDAKTSAEREPSKSCRADSKHQHGNIAAAMRSQSRQAEAMGLSPRWTSSESKELGHPP